MEKLIHIPFLKEQLGGMLKIPDRAKTLVLFAHGSGSSRHSPRNNYVADFLNEGHLATLLIDLLTPLEDQDYRMRFNIDLLQGRLQLVIEWLFAHSDTKNLAIGLFGSSTGAAAALQAASVLGTKIQSVVSRGGRPDLALPYLYKVMAPTLLIVGGRDNGVIELNQEAFQQLNCEKKTRNCGRGHSSFCRARMLSRSGQTSSGVVYVPSRKVKCVSV